MCMNSEIVIVFFLERNFAIENDFLCLLFLLPIYIKLESISAQFIFDFICTLKYVRIIFVTTLTNTENNFL